jgi:hypothetical protein
MSKVIVLLLIVVVVGGLGWLLAGGSRKLGRHSRSVSSRAASGTRTTSQLSPGASQLEKMRENQVFWGVSLENPGCDAAMELFEKGIPLTDAPDLPLPGCDAVQCNCRWKGLTEQRHTTRRTHHDRRDGVRFDDKEKSDRRSHKDRRKSAATWERRDF